MWAEGIVCAKALKQVISYILKALEWKPVWLEYSKQEQMMSER